VSRPRRGPLARAYRIVYWAFVVGLLASISLSVTHHVMVGDGEAAGGRLDEATCRAALSARYDALQAAAAAHLFGERVPRPEVESDWRTFTLGWHNDLKAVRARCDLAGNRDLRLLSRDIERVHVAWSTAFGALGQLARQPLARLPDRLAPALNSL
jgi:hypothetical protein